MYVELRNNGIIMARHRLMKAVLAVQKGVEPPGRNPAAHRVRSVSMILPPNVAFKDAAKDALQARPGVAHATV